MISQVIKYCNWLRRVVRIRFGVVLCILGMELEIELKFEFSLTLVNVLSFGAQIGLLNFPMVTGGDF